MASGSSKSDMRKDEGSDESLNEDPAIVADDEASLLSAVAKGNSRPTGEGPSTPRFRLADASAQSHWENVVSPSIGLNDPMKFVVPIVSPPKMQRMPDSGKKKITATGSSNRPAPSTVSDASTAPHDRRKRTTVTPALSDPQHALDWRRVHRDAQSEPYQFPKVPSTSLENSSQYLGSDEPSPFQSMPNSCDLGSRPVPVRLGFMGHYKIYSSVVIDSYYIIPFLLLIIGLSVFACYMGVAYFGQCHFLSDTPFILVLQGTTMAMALVARIVYIINKRYSTNLKNFRFVTFGGIGVFLVCYIMEFLFYNIKSGHPSTETGPTYCHPFFYNYLFWHNWSALLILIIMTIVHGPYCFNFNNLID